MVEPVLILFAGCVPSRISMEEKRLNRERMGPLMQAALAEVPAIIAELPLGWLHVDGDESLPVQLDMKRVISALELPFADPDTFWKLP